MTLRKVGTKLIEKSHPRNVFGVVILSSFPLISSRIMSIGVGCAGGAGEVALTKLLIDSSDTKFAFGAADVENCGDDDCVLILEKGVGLKMCCQVICPKLMNLPIKNTLRVLHNHTISTVTEIIQTETYN